MKPEDSTSPDSRTLVRRGVTDSSVVSELLGLLALPAAWSGCEPRRVLEMLLEALEAILPVHLAYAVATAPDGAPIEVVRIASAPADQRLDELRVPFRECLGYTDVETQTLNDGELSCIRIASSPYDLGARRVGVVVGSRLADFPDETETSILRAATKLLAEGLASTDALREREAMSRAREEFVATIVHELRHPLAPIVMALDLLKARSDMVHSSEISVIERQVQHLSRLIDDVSNWSRRTRGELEVKKQVIELGNAVADGIEAARPLVSERRHDLCVDVPARGLRILADRTRMAEVVANLLTNAAKYTEPGGRIELSAWREGQVVILRVSDNGIGIAAELLPHVFDRFVRGSSERGRALPAQEGLGIGLAVVEHLISLHGGTVAAWSGGVGDGSAFTVRLPALDKASGSYRLSSRG
jgi:signal transduction histidine kinase